MQRRRFLTVAGAGIASGLAGCAAQSGSPGDDGDSGTSNDDGDSSAGSAPFEHPGTIDEPFATNGDYPPNEELADGFPPTFPNPPAPANADVSTFDTLSVNGESVKLAPIDVVERWYRRAEARFVDARGLVQYERSHIYGSVLSTAQQESTGGGIPGWDKDDRVVTYCRCPHHLSSIRAAGLQKAGFSRVFALDEGFGVWAERGYPMAGTTFVPGNRSDVSKWTLTGTLPSRYAGDYVWAAFGKQYEAAPIREDGSFTLTLRFSSVTSETPVRLSTPAFTITRPLGELASGRITGK